MFSKKIWLYNKVTCCHVCAKYTLNIKYQCELITNVFESHISKAVKRKTCDHQYLFCSNYK